MTEHQFTELSLAIGLTGGSLYMLYIVYKLAEESRAGKFGLLVLMLGLGLGIFGFAAKFLIKFYLSTHMS